MSGIDFLSTQKSPSSPPTPPLSHWLCFRLRHTARQRLSPLGITLILIQKSRPRPLGMRSSLISHQPNFIKNELFYQRDGKFGYVFYSPGNSGPDLTWSKTFGIGEAYGPVIQSGQAFYEPETLEMNTPAPISGIWVHDYAFFSPQLAPFPLRIALTSELSETAERSGWTDLDLTRPGHGRIIQLCPRAGERRVPRHGSTIDGRQRYFYQVAPPSRRRAHNGRIQ
jgi:hypothetical protein